MFESLGLVGVVLAVILVIGAIVAAILLIRGRSRSGPGEGRLGDGMRIGILESVAVDARRRLVLVRRDDVEHLVMIGGPSEFVVEANIGRTGAKALADGEASPAGQRAIKEAADRHAPAPEPIAAAPAKFTFDETELLQDFDAGEEAPKPAAAPDIQRRREPAPIVNQTHTPPQTPRGAANDQHGIGEAGLRARPSSTAESGMRETAGQDTPDWKRRAETGHARATGGDTNGAAIRRMSPVRPSSDERARQSGEERIRQDGEDRARSAGEERGRQGSEERAKSEPRRIPHAQDARPSPEQPVIRRDRMMPRAEMPATRQLPSVTTTSQSANGLSAEDADIENEIVRALGMDVEPQQSLPAPTPSAQPTPAKSAGEPRTRLGDLADRLEEALAREVRSAGQAKSRLDVDLDSFGFDRERSRQSPTSDRPQAPNLSGSGDQNTARPADMAAQREKPATSEPADNTKRENRLRPEQRQENPPVISLSARRRETSDPLEDEMARLLGELTDGGRR